MKPRRLPYLITELLCLLCFALLILPMGEKYHLYPSESQPALGLLCLGEYLLALPPPRGTAALASGRGSAADVGLMPPDSEPVPFSGLLAHHAGAGLFR